VHRNLTLFCSHLVQLQQQAYHKLLEQSTANAREATEQANKLEIKISKYNAYSEYYKKLSTKLLEGSNSLKEEAQALRDNAALLDEFCIIIILINYLIC
jgi:DNA-binding protein H-NS